MKKKSAVKASVTKKPKLATVNLRVPNFVADVLEGYSQEEIADIMDRGLTTLRMEMEEDHKLTDPMVKMQQEAAAKEPSFLEQADKLINGSRQQDYGDKLINFSQIAMLWQGYFAPKLQPNALITPEDIALAMSLVKVARLSKSPNHYDSILDVAGYSGCYDKLQRERSATDTVLPGALRDYGNTVTNFCAKL